MTTSIVTGSLSDIAQRNNQTLAESFLSCDCIVVVDISGSMCADDNVGKSRYERACESLAELQRSLPGKIAVISFSDQAQFEPSGVPFFTGGSTNLAGALRFVKIADVPDMRFVLIADGNPDSKSEALKVARTFTNRIDTIFVGDERSAESIRFMQELARVSSGQQITADSARIGESVKLLLENGR